MPRRKLSNADRHAIARSVVRRRIEAQLAAPIASPNGLYVSPQVSVDVEGHETMVPTSVILDELGAVPGGDLNYYWPKGTPYRCRRCNEVFEPARRPQAFCSEECKRAAFYNEPLESAEQPEEGIAS